MIWLWHRVIDTDVGGIFLMGLSSLLTCRLSMLLDATLLLDSWRQSMERSTCFQLWQVPWEYPFLYTKDVIYVLNALW